MLQPDCVQEAASGLMSIGVPVTDSTKMAKGRGVKRTGKSAGGSSSASRKRAKKQLSDLVSHDIHCSQLFFAVNAYQFHIGFHMLSSLWGLT